MAEYTTIAAGHNIKYEGYVDVSAFWKQMRSLLEKRGYTYMEREHNEVVAKDGKNIYMRADNERELSDDIKSRLVIELVVENSREITVEIDERPKRVNDCSLKINVSAYLISDYQGRYDHVASLFFLRRIYEKYFGVRELKKLKRVVERDYQDIVREAKNYLNLNKY